MNKNWKDWDIVITGGDVKEKTAYVYSCMKACANLPEPEKNIRELAQAARLVVGEIDTDEAGTRLPPSRQSIDRLEKALPPFKEKQNERPLD